MAEGGRPLVLTGTVKPRSRAAEASVAGSRVDVRFSRRLQADETATVDLPAAGSAPVTSDGAFRVEVGGTGDPVEPILLTVSAPDGTELHRGELTLAQAGEPLAISVRASKRFEIEASGDPALGERLAISGRVIDTRGRGVPAGLPVVVWAVDKDAANGTPRPATVGETTTGGYFSADWTSELFKSAFGRVAGGEAVPVRLEADGRLPLQILLVTDVPDEEVGDGAAPPRAPEPDELAANPVFSQDLGGGCVSLATPNRTIEEFSYHFVVRTTEPDVRGLTLGDRAQVPGRVVGDLIRAAGIDSALALSDDEAALERVSRLESITLDASAAKRLVRGDRPPTLAEIARGAWLSEVAWVKDLIGVAVGQPGGRTALDADHPIDWDSTPTIYQAVGLAHGHVLEYREVWRADGYSLGDLLYSLPLAPGQRRRIAVVDWDRRAVTAREEALEFEEELEAVVGRDRDVREIVGSRLHEETDAASKNSTWGVAAGIGAGYIGSGWGIFGGVAGGMSGSNSTAWQESSRDFSANSVQSLRDRVQQRSSSVRDERATVVQTVAQGETLRAETEVVANYNHCHAVTVEYFQVLRHFLITHELADVRECLFVPFPMSPFDRGKALRWREPLALYLRDRSLRRGFDAIRRIADNWEGWEYPQSRYSEEAPEVLEGELRISFVLPRPRDKEDGAFQIDMWRPYSWLLPVDALELWTAQLSERAAAERDRVFREQIAPGIAERLVQRLRFAYVTANGSEVEVPLDATLVSRYAEGRPLYVTLRPRGGLPAIPREEIARFKLWSDGELPPDARVIVHSGKVRYRTPFQTALLFRNDRILDDLAVGDDVVVPTPLSREELRDPRQEDRDLADRLVTHLNESIEYYHQALWASLDPQRRFMLLDGVLVPGLNGVSVASIVENRLIGIAGNSLVMPLAPGRRIDPRVDTESEGDLRDLYAVDAPPPLRVTVPTRGVYAEAVQGECNACEQIDDTRYWRWSVEGMLEPPEIKEVSTESRAQPEDELRPTDLPKPLVQIQNAPELPAPTALRDVLGLLAKSPFTDITGLEGTQKNALAALEAAVSAASSMGKQAGDLAKQQFAGRNAGRMLDRIDRAKKDGLLTPQAAEDLTEATLRTLVGEPTPAEESPAEDPAVKQAIDEAAQSEKASVKVSTPAETVEAAFSGGKVGAGPATVGSDATSALIDQEIITEDPPTPFGAAPARTINETRFSSAADLKATFPAALLAILDAKGFLKEDSTAKFGYKLLRRLRFGFPADPKDPTKLVPGGDRLPLAVIVHGNHASWTSAGEVANHEGYTYLQDELAREGIVSVSVDTNAANFFNSIVEMRAEMVLEALDTMQALDKDAKSIFHGRLDLSKVVLIGHSRGGDAVVRAAVLNAARGAGKAGIRAVCAIAPTDLTGQIDTIADVKKGTTRPGKYSLTPARSAFYLALYGALDGDVAADGGAPGFVGTAFRHFDRATCAKAMAFFSRCSHNRFNRTWSTDESRIRPTDIGNLLLRTDHEKLAMEYIRSLVRWRLKGDVKERDLFDGTKANTVGADLSLQWSFGRDVKALDEFEKATPEVGTRTIRNATVKQLADFTIGALKVADHSAHQTGVLGVDKGIAAPVKPVLELALPAGERDWTSFTWLMFRVSSFFDVTADPPTGPLPEFSLTLTDGKNAAATVDHTKVAAGSVTGFTKPVHHELATGEDLSLLRLESHRVKLSDFAGVDLTDVRKLELTPPATFSAEMFFDSLRLVRP